MRASPAVAGSNREVRVSVVIPMLNEAGNLPALFARLFPALDSLGEEYEVIAVDDGSTDATLALLKEARALRGDTLCITSFARNFGQHSAVMAGFRAARGEWVITLDADLQNPPEEIPNLVEAFRKGHDLINTRRVGRQDTWFRKTVSRAINHVMRRFSGITLGDFGCMLRGYHRDVVRRMSDRTEFHTFIPALATLYSRDPIEIPVSHAARAVGSSKYSLWRLFTLQLDLMASFSLAPLRLLFTVGGAIAVLGMLFGAFLLSARLIFGAEWAAQGVFTLFAVLFFFVGAQFVAFGLLGEYVGRIYQEVRQRPTYVVREELPAPEPAVVPRQESARPEGSRPESSRDVRT